jgi:protein O-mannosyl-transferase
MKLTPRQQKVLLGLLLCLLAGIAWWPVTRCGFVTLDDSAYVTENPNVQAGLTLPGAAWAFTTFHSANWHPLTWLSHMLDAQLYDLRPLGHHVTSLLFHLANTLLLFLLFNRMTGALWRSALVAALFALHPLHVESVAWVSERKDVLSLFFGLLSLLAYVRYAGQAEGRMQNAEGGTGHASKPHSAFCILHSAFSFYLLSLLFFALALMSKPMLVTLPFLLLLLDYWPLGRIMNDEGRMMKDEGKARSRFIIHHSYFILLEKLPFFLLTGISSAITFAVQRSGGAVMSAVELPLSGRIANALVGYLRYLGKMFWPTNLACFYPRPEHWPAWQVALAALVLAGITVVALRLLSSHRYVAVGWLWFVGTLVPVIGLVQVGEQAIADRYTYLPSIGLFALIAWALGDLAARQPRLKPLLASAAAVAVGALLLVTRQQVPYWQTSEALFRHTLAVTRDNPWVHCLLASTLADTGHFEEAQTQCQEALRLKPGFPEIEILCARILAQANKPDEAIAVLSRLLRQNPADPAIQVTLASILTRKGETSQAIEHYRQALALKPADAEVYFHLAALLAQQGDTAAAVEQYQQGLRLQPNLPDALNNLAWIRAANANPALRNGDEAVRLARRACELTGNRRPVMLGTLAAAYAEAGRFDDAVATAQKACDLAQATGQPELATQNQTLLTLYQSHRPYHESPSPSPPAPSHP